MPVKITVGIIARNEEKNIYKTLKNILNQSFDQKTFEIVVVDGNSVDNTMDIAMNILGSSNVKYKVINEADYGFYGHCFARNLVIDNSDPDSKYIAFTDADCIVDTNWLNTLYNAIIVTDESVAGVGGPRLIAETKDKKELVINAFLTTYLASGGNPAFFKRNVKYVKSIANYNAMYKKTVISKFRYDDKLIMSDDNEINLRLRKAGYSFINVPNAMVWHHETNSIKQFASNMFHYGVNITNTVKKHRSFVTVNVPLTVVFIIYLILLSPIYLLLGSIILIPLLLYIIFALAVLVEVGMRTRTVYSLLVLILLPIQHISYGLGVLWNLFLKRKTLK
jgi:glycosyltransferase involved in cell wall biosynthesis